MPTLVNENPSIYFPFKGATHDNLLPSGRGEGERASTDPLRGLETLLQTNFLCISVGRLVGLPRLCASCSALKTGPGDTVLDEALCLGDGQRELGLGLTHWGTGLGLLGLLGRLGDLGEKGGLLQGDSWQGKGSEYPSRGNPIGANPSGGSTLWERTLLLEPFQGNGKKETEEERKKKETALVALLHGVVLVLVLVPLVVVLDLGVLVLHVLVLFTLLIYFSPPVSAARGACMKQNAEMQSCISVIHRKSTL